MPDAGASRKRQIQELPGPFIHTPAPRAFMVRLHIVATRHSWARMAFDVV